jgi:hypothetical protein
MGETTLGVDDRGATALVDPDIFGQAVPGVKQATHSPSDVSRPIRPEIDHPTVLGITES